MKCLVAEKAWSQNYKLVKRFVDKLIKHHWINQGTLIKGKDSLQYTSTQKGGKEITYSI
jgi:hypothetical protein